MRSKGGKKPHPPKARKSQAEPRGNREEQGGQPAVEAGMQLRRGVPVGKCGNQSA